MRKSRRSRRPNPRTAPASKFPALIAVAMTCGGCLLAPVGANATLISYDETLYQATSGDPSQLLAKVDMTVSGQDLTISLQNVSLAGAADSTALAAAMISGIAFNLPSGVFISGGSITPMGVQSPNPWNPTTANQQWGYSNDGTGGALDYAALSYGAEASTMGSDVGTEFQSGGVIDGLNYGAVSQNITPPGTPNVIDTIQLDLTLSGNLTGLLSYIDSHPIGVIFGSADSTTHSTPVPEPGTLALLGLGLAGLGFARRRKLN